VNLEEFKTSQKLKPEPKEIMETALRILFFLSDAPTVTLCNLGTYAKFFLSKVEKEKEAKKE
jgi:hypothetical protein